MHPYKCGCCVTLRNDAVGASETPHTLTNSKTHLSFLVRTYAFVFMCVCVVLALPPAHMLVLDFHCVALQICSLLCHTTPHRIGILRTPTSTATRIDRAASTLVFISQCALCAIVCQRGALNFLRPVPHSCASYGAYVFIYVCIDLAYFALLRFGTYLNSGLGQIDLNRHLFACKDVRIASLMKQRF